ncbi:MAG TPA: hypothetical protein VKS21_00445 [Spirochaetota bacterium]|nr:hypothetical protein [Spirochaetota bacterium]
MNFKYVTAALLVWVTVFAALTAGQRAFELNFKGEQGIINYKKYGYFRGRGTRRYRYVIRDKAGLIRAVGDGVYPAFKLIERDPKFKLYKKKRLLIGSHWDFLGKKDQRRAFYKWIMCGDDPGVKQHYIAGILEKAGHLRQALKAYYAVVLHFPLTVGWAASGDWFYFLGPGALGSIKRILRDNPEIPMKLVGAKLKIKPKDPNDLTQDEFIKSEYEIEIDPGNWEKRKPHKKIVDKTPVKYLPDKKAAVHVVKHKDGSFSMEVNHEPYYIKGAGYGCEDGSWDCTMDQLAARGGNTIRTWGHKDAQDALACVEAAHKYGIRVCLGLWIDHERHGFDYNDQAAVQKRFKHFTSIIDAVKDHPGLLVYGIGNEVNHQSTDGVPYQNMKVWDQINNVAAYAHKHDGNHPTATVTVNWNADLEKQIRKRCPEIDIIGVNSYAGINGAVAAIDMVDWDKAYMVTEWGPYGFWEVELTDWDAPIENPSAVKARNYFNRYKFITGKERCLGSFVFVWGYKQERTHTWFNLFLEDPQGGPPRPTAVVDIMEAVWTGEVPDNRAPRVGWIEIKGFPGQKSCYLEKDTEYTVNVAVKEFENEAMDFFWEVYEESRATSVGGDREVKPDKMDIKFKIHDNGRMVFRTPSQKGPYRLFLQVSDPHDHIGYANYPFYVK